MVQASDAFENPLTVGSGDLSQIRIDILQRAKIRTMPPEAVQCKLRKLDDGMVSGTMLPMPYGKGYVFGVMLPAHTALCYDTTVIRRVLVREFRHAFLKMQLVLESMNRGEASMKDEFKILIDPLTTYDWAIHLVGSLLKALSR